MPKLKMHKETRIASCPLEVAPGTTGVVYRCSVTKDSTGTNWLSVLFSERNPKLKTWAPKKLGRCSVTVSPGKEVAVSKFWCEQLPAGGTCIKIEFAEYTLVEVTWKEYAWALLPKWLTTRL